MQVPLPECYLERLRMVEAVNEEAAAILKLELEPLNRQLLVRWLTAWTRLLGVR